MGMSANRLQIVDCCIINLFDRKLKPVALKILSNDSNSSEEYKDATEICSNISSSFNPSVLNLHREAAITASYSCNQTETLVHEMIEDIKVKCCFVLNVLLHLMCPLLSDLFERDD